VCDLSDVADKLIVLAGSNFTRKLFLAGADAVNAGEKRLGIAQGNGRTNCPGKRPLMYCITCLRAELGSLTWS
jgi:hypothetical protein